MSKNKNLHSAKKEKNDEFYTLYEDVEKEVEEYKDQLKDKIIFCNCDDPESSNFWKYLSNNFTYYNLKKLISSHYDPNGNSYKLEISRDINGDGNIDKLDTQKTTFKGNGDFRSDECIEILKECDIVITNPPFSLFREYIAQLMEYDKKFLVIGSYNAITYKEVFGFIKENKLWLGNSFVKNFIKPNGEIQKFGNICWFTNLDNRKRHIDLIRNVLYKKYNEVDYPKYDNYDAININKVADIPVDYFGYMGVPITYLSNHNPEQFEIIGLGISNSGIEIGVKPYKPEHKKYRKEIQKRGAVDGDLYMITNGIVDVPYARILIKRK
ncbi:MAG: adenine-specific methyltransferase EcoRI family protein [Candidatus Muirbacterium halophilum]|nr:adenine-specific methyltransferase EcoRI family protein [Candidatus Muirbacterium halophilum]